MMSLKNKEFVTKLLRDVNFFNTRFPMTIDGYDAFLNSKSIFTVEFKNDNNKWQWYGFEIVNDKREVFSEDFTEYNSVDECIEAAMLESLAYLANKIKYESC